MVVGALLFCGAFGCGATFRMPTVPVVPAAPRLPETPSPVEERERGQAPGETDVAAAPGARLGRGALVAVAPMRAGDRDLGALVLRQMLRRRHVRVLDLTGAGDVTVEVARGREDERQTVRGPMLAVTWGVRPGAATHVLLAQGLRTEVLPITEVQRRRIEPESLAAYGAALERAQSGCQGPGVRLAREAAEFRAAFARALTEWETGRSRVFPSDPAPVEEGRQRLRDFDEASERFVELCRRASSLPDVDAVRRGGTSEAVSQVDRVGVASGEFRVVGVPGGEVLWSAALRRVGATPDEALDRLIDAALDALPTQGHGERTERSEAAGEAVLGGAPAEPVRARRRRR